MIKNNWFIPAFVLVITLITIAFNSLANILPLNGLNTGQISDRYPVLFVPAGYVFSIWGLIYIVLVAYSVYQLLPAQRSNTRLQRIAPLYMVSGLANMVWLALWHFEQITLSLAAMLVLLASLIAIYLVLRGGNKKVSRSESLFIRLPFSIYLGWVSVATIANASTVLYNLGWNGGGINPVIWTVSLMIIGGILAGTALLTRRDVAYSLVFVWAFTGIAVKHADVQPIMLAGYIISAFLLVAAMLTLARRQSTLKAATV